ncbi:MAG: flippase-like domain-containing protein [Elusimicrobia bacterium]|nr:flippase-like domain-containing protein [Elusimicrobiota bacterium]
MSKTLWTLWLAGTALFVWMVREIGWGEVMGLVQTAGFWIGFFALFYALAQSCFVEAWRLTIQNPTPIPFRWLFRVYLAGDALNILIPSGNLAGEPVKVRLLTQRFPQSHATASVTINKFSELVAMTLFIAAGVGIGILYLTLPGTFQIASLITLLGLGGLLVAVFLRQKKGFYAPLAAFAQKLGIGRKSLEKRLPRIREIDHAIGNFYQNHPLKFLGSLLFNFLGWMGGAVEVYWILRLLDLPASWSHALAIEALSLISYSLLFFLPARIGGGDGSRVLIFIALGFSSATGLAFSIIRRLREMIWIGLGLLSLLTQHLRPTRALPQPARPQ